MNIKPGIRDFAWMASGALIFLAVLLVILHFEGSKDPAAQLRSKTERLAMVSQMQLSLTSASEAEKNTMLAATEEESQRFADQARAATADVEKNSAKLAELLAATGNTKEKDLLAQFNETFVDFQQIDKDLLALAVKNTNIQASRMTLGPATTAIKEMDAALARLSADDVTVMRIVYNARIAGWRLLTLLPPHIAEESDQKMDEIELQMDKEERQVRQSLKELADMPGFAKNHDLMSAASSYAKFQELKGQILKLSRENTNVRSLSISLNQKRKVKLVCEASLIALQQAIQAEPVGGINFDIKPR